LFCGSRRQPGLPIMQPVLWNVELRCPDGTCARIQFPQGTPVLTIKKRFFLDVKSLNTERPEDWDLALDDNGSLGDTLSLVLRNRDQGSKSSKSVSQDSAEGTKKPTKRPTKSDLRCVA
jgi:hypothetical protein